MRTCTITTLFLLFSLLAPASTPEATPVHREPQWWWFLAGPAKDTPPEQLSYCEELITKGKERKAIKQLSRLVNFWPESKEAPQALIKKIDLFETRGDLANAFETCQESITRYAGEFDYEAILQRQLDLARQKEDQRVAKMLFLPGFEAPEKAIPFYEQIITNAPQWESTAKIQYRIGEIEESLRSYDKAIEAFEKVLSRYDDPVYEEKASFHRAYCLYQLALESPNDEASAEAAWAALTLHLSDHKGSDSSEEAYTFQQEMHQRLAKFYYEKGLYYDAIAQKPKAALIAYRAFVEQFKTSAWTETAKSRIKELEQAQETP